MNNKQYYRYAYGYFDDAAGVFQIHDFIYVDNTKEIDAGYVTRNDIFYTVNGKLLITVSKSVSGAYTVQNDIVVVNLIGANTVVNGRKCYTPVDIVHINKALGGEFSIFELEGICQDTDGSVLFCCNGKKNGAEYDAYYKTSNVFY